MHSQSSFILQKKASRLIHFKERNTHTNSVFFKSKMVKLPPKKVKIESCLQQFISKYVNNKSFPIFNSCFIFSSNFHNYETSFLTKGHRQVPTDTTTTYVKGTLISMVTKIWNNIQSQTEDPMITIFSLNNLKNFFFDFYLNLYQT